MKIKSLILLLIFISCKDSSSKKKIASISPVVDSSKYYIDNLKVLHDKYRTFWYRTNKECFYDSTRKYGLLLDSALGMKPINISYVDTVTINEKATCK